MERPVPGMSVEPRKYEVCQNCDLGIQVDVLHAALVERTPGAELKEREAYDFYLDDPIWGVIAFACPRCGEVNIYLGTASRREYGGQGWLQVRGLLYPLPTDSEESVLVPSEVPRDIAEDYREAAAVLGISPKGSAALSRRCLQNLLSHAAKTKSDNLASQIDEVLNVNGHLRIPIFGHEKSPRKE